MPSDKLPHYQQCLLVWCLIIVQALCCGASLSAMSVGVVPPCRPCLLVGCLTIVHACWYGTLCLTVGHACRPLATATDILQCRCKKDGNKCGATCAEVPLHQTCLLSWCHSQICLLVQHNSIRHACVCL